MSLDLLQQLKDHELSVVSEGGEGAGRQGRKALRVQWRSGIENDLNSCTVTAKLCLNEITRMRLFMICGFPSYFSNPKSFVNKVNTKI